MRHPDGLRAAAAAAIPIGTSMEGGFFGGYISQTANGVATHALIVAPAATGATGSGYTLTTTKEWKTSNTTTAGTTSTYDGATNSTAMNNASHPAAQFCENLSIGGFTDWYLPARNELEIIYYNLKPTTTANTTSFGINAYSIPAQGSNYTSGDPAQTTVTAFQVGNSEAFIASAHWTSTEFSSTNGQGLFFGDGSQYDYSKDTLLRVRAIRKVVV